jgi:hypothetical protein
MSEAHRSTETQVLEDALAVAVEGVEAWHRVSSWNIAMGRNEAIDRILSRVADEQLALREKQR